MPTILFPFLMLVFLFAVGCDGGDQADDDASPVDDDDDNDNNNDDTSDDDDDDDDNDDDDDDDDNDNDNDNDTTPLCQPPATSTPQPLRAGVAVGDLYAPIGISMAGFGGRSGPKHPFAKMLGGSTGYIDRLNVKALTLDVGTRRIVITRLPTISVGELMHRKVLDRVCELTGVDLTGSLWISATHTHSGPAHHMPTPVLLGSAGGDTYDDAVTNRMAESVAQVIKDSMESLEPATLDAEVVTPFDPTDQFSADRRCQNWPDYKDDRLFMARVDRTDGTPLAALVSYPVHGVMMGTTVMTSDVPGVVEWGLQQTFDTPVEVLFLQGPAGDINPRGSPLGHHGQAEMDWYAASVTPALRAVYDELTPGENPALRFVSRRLTPSREAIGYQPGEYGHYNLFTGDFEEYPDGTFYCGDRGLWDMTDYFINHGSIIDCGDPETSMLDGYYGCLLPNFLIGAFWLDYMPETQVGGLVLDDILLSLVPVELSSDLSQNLRWNLEDTVGWAPDKIATFGYSQGFQLYLLTAWDWQQGGYETSISLWGPKYGDWLVSEAADLAAQLLTPDDEFPEPFTVLTDLPPDLCATGFEPGEQVGAILAQVQPSYERFDTVDFSWAGGYTGVGNPQVFFERETARGFEPVILPDGRPLTDASFDTAVNYVAEPGYDTVPFPAGRLHRFTIRWELLAGTPTGWYRVRVEGENWDGSAVVPHTVVSDTFAVLASTDITIQNLAVESAGGDSYQIECDGYWPPNPQGARLRRVDTGPNDYAPVTGGSASVRILVDGGTEESATLTAGEDGHFTGVFTMTQVGLAHAALVDTGGLTDSYGNANSSPVGPISFP